MRFACLFIFNAGVLLLIGFLTPASVGFSALWAAVVMTVLVLFVKPLVHKWFTSLSAKSRPERTSAGEGLVQLLVVLAVAWVVWVLTVIFSGIRAPGWLWAYALPPIIIAIGWVVYAKIVDRFEAKAGEIYDSIDQKAARSASGSSAPSAATDAARAEANDGLTPEQRKMLDEL
ncbi:hypothetical protein [Microbacterium sp. NIBRBAC000506063]|uniref:hypothetical protein n=1 Tax=Microbacterium sp. NIBRBAC000506063 TaxID=2734618 RepID=UPI001CB7503B|nr:hypothetical protein [Microbacterium sp. NIBRBAC000506063]